MEPNAVDTKQESRSAKYLWLILVAVAALVIAGAIFAWTQNNDNEPEEAPQSPELLDPEFTPQTEPSDTGNEADTDQPEPTDDDDTDATQQPSSDSSQQETTAGNPNILDVDITILSRDQIRPKLETYIPEFIAEEFVVFLESHRDLGGAEGDIFHTYQDDTDFDGDLDECQFGMRVLKVSQLNVMAGLATNGSCFGLGATRYFWGLSDVGEWGWAKQIGPFDISCEEFAGLTFAIYEEFARCGELDGSFNLLEGEHPFGSYPS